MNRTAIVVALVAAFLIGASLGLVGGVAFTLAQHRGQAPPWADGPRRGDPGERSWRDRRPPRGAAVLPRLRRTLELTDEQAALIEPLVLEAHRAMSATRDSLRVRIEKVLTPGQRERWRRLEARHGVPGQPRGPLDRAHRAQPGEEGEPK